MVTKTEQFTRRMPRVDEPGRFGFLSNEHYSVTHDWVATAFLGDVVRLGTGAENLETVYPAAVELPKAYLTEEEVKLFFSRIDATVPLLPSRKRYEHLQKEFNLPNQFNEAAQVLSVVMDPFFRKGSYELMGGEYIRSLYKKIVGCIEYTNPLEIVVPSLPFKDQCAITTAQPIGEVDLGERLFLMRLDLMARSIMAVSGLRTKITLVTDGNVYADIFTLNGKSQISEYFSNCQELVQSIGASKTVNLVDMSSIVALEPRFAEIKVSIKNMITDLITTGSTQVVETWQALVRGMLFNCQMPEQFSRYEAFTSLAKLSVGDIQQQHPQVFEIISNAALEYATFLLTMKKLNMLNRHFHAAGAIRATVHPKKGQLGLHTLGSEVAPYNGVPVVNLAEFQRDARLTNQKWYGCQRLYRVLQEGQSISQVVDEQGRTLCYVKQ